MSLLAFVKYSSHFFQSSSAGVAMAVLRRGLYNLSISGNSTNGTRQYEGFLSSPLPFLWNLRNTSRNVSKYNHVQSCSRVSGVSPVIREVMGVRSFSSNKNIRSTSSKEGKNLNCSKESRFYFAKRYLKNQEGLNLAGEKGGKVGSRKDFFVSTPDGSLDLSLESSFGQVSRNLEQEFGDVSGEDSLPRGTYQSPDDTDRSALHHGAAADHVCATITEVDIGAMVELEDALGFPLGQEPQSPSPKPLVIVISGPSGVGKDAVIKKLQYARGDIHFVVTATTRSMRSNEVDGVDYHFMSKTEFQEMIENHELLEYAMVYGDYKGIPKQQVREFMTQGMDVVLRVDVQGAATVRSILGSEAVFIFLVAESETALVKRLIERKTETMDKMLVRVATAREELTRMEEFDYVVVNQEGCLDRTVSLICSIIDSEKARVKPKSAEI